MVHEPGYRPHAEFVDALQASIRPSPIVAICAAFHHLPQYGITKRPNAESGDEIKIV